VYCPEKATDALSNHINIYALSFGAKTSLGKPLDTPGKMEKLGKERGEELLQENPAFKERKES
jgi:hypothetical protein